MRADLGWESVDRWLSIECWWPCTGVVRGSFRCCASPSAWSLWQPLKIHYDFRWEGHNGKASLEEGKSLHRRSQTVPWTPKSFGQRSLEVSGENVWSHTLSTWKGCWKKHEMRIFSSVTVLEVGYWEPSGNGSVCIHTGLDFVIHYDTGFGTLWYFIHCNMIQKLFKLWRNKHAVVKFCIGISICCSFS